MKDPARRGLLFSLLRRQSQNNAPRMPAIAAAPAIADPAITPLLTFLAGTGAGDVEAAPWAVVLGEALPATATD